VSASNSASTPDSPTPSAAGTYLASTVSGNEDNLLFSTLRGTNTGPDGGNNDGTDNTKVNGTDRLSDTTSYAVAAGSADLLNVELIVSGIDIHASAGGGGSVEIETCVGSTLANAMSAGCSAGTLQTQTITLSTASSLNTTITFASPAQFVGVTDVIAVACNLCTTNESGFLAWSNNFDDSSPEPSTFVLMGTALAAVAFLAYRRRRTALGVR